MQQKMIETTKETPSVGAKKKREKEERAQLRLKLRSYDSKVMDKSCHQIVEMADRSGVKIIGPVPMPTEFHRYTVNRSTFVHKNAREQFEMRFHKRLIEVLNPNQKFMDFLRELTLPTGVDIEVRAI
jgi:small subunit ribosomal protein S10